MALINCPECGQTVSDQALACIKCGYQGAPFAGAKKSEPEEVDYETCQIRWSVKTVLGGYPSWQGQSFWAEAIHPLWGPYNAGESQKFERSRLTYGSQIDPILEPRGDHTATLNAHNELLNQLSQDGWESTDSIGHRWWERSFRRPVPESSELTVEQKLYSDQQGTDLIEELPIGTGLRVLAVAPNRQWARVQLDDDRIGYLQLHDQTSSQSKPASSSGCLGVLVVLAVLATLVVGLFSLGIGGALY